MQRQQHREEKRAVGCGRLPEACDHCREDAEEGRRPRRRQAAAAHAKQGAANAEAQSGAGGRLPPVHPHHHLARRAQLKLQGTVSEAAATAASAEAWTAWAGARTYALRRARARRADQRHWPSWQRRGAGGGCIGRLAEPRECKVKEVVGDVHLAHRELGQREQAGGQLARRASRLGLERLLPRGREEREELAKERRVRNGVAYRLSAERGEQAIEVGQPRTAVRAGGAESGGEAGGVVERQCCAGVKG
mmetsp:Transcript_9992/g.33379  ORF Transcript_9992/g.33379 Transcript_9992/m.33379 type:complete len:249 (-) Transcript_9992:48-794(-)